MLFLLVCVALCSADDPPYDHQNATYVTTFEPVSVNGAATLMPFFSPDHSIGTTAKLIEEAQHTVDIGSPGFSSWSGCTSFSKDCVGCYVDEQRAEAFPVFQAVLNALHRGIDVRIVTNDFGSVDCEGKISPLPFLALNGAKIRYYTSTTFIHEKFLAIDARKGTKGGKVAISSINYSKTSFTRNREAGGVLSGNVMQPLMDFAASVYDYDFTRGRALVVTNKYTKAEMKVITDTSPVPVVIPPPPSDPSWFITPTPEAVTASNASVRVGTSPDFARRELHLSLQAEESLDVMMYQITGDLCDEIFAVTQRGVNVSLLLSSRIYDAADCAAAQACYPKLYAAGATMHLTPRYYEYSHQKFWLVDGHRIAWSTGNMSPSDYPARTAGNASASFPPYGSSSWQSTNRDYTVYVDNFPAVFDQFHTVMTEDMERGTVWSPSNDVQCGFEL